MHTPTVIVSGSLGSGKTTVIKSIVAANPGCRFGVLVNEFGEIGIDGDLLRPYVPQVVEIRNGCICCVTQDQLVPAVKEILAKFSVDIVLIEMSGVGEPAPVIQQLGVLFPLIEVRSHLVLVDSTMDPDIATRDQGFCGALAVADIIGYTKSDIAIPVAVAQWERFLGSFNSRASLIEATNGNVDILELTKPRRRGGGFRAEEQAVGANRVVRPSFASVSEFVDPISACHLKRLMALEGMESARIKGIVEVGGIWMEVQSVRGMLKTEPFAGKPPSRGRMVFISESLSSMNLQQIVRAGLVDTTCSN